MGLSTFVVSLLAAAAFGLGLWGLSVLAITKTLSSEAMKGISAMLDSELDDDSKEVLIRRSGLSLLAHGWRVAWRLVVTLFLAAFPILISDAMGITLRGEVIALMLRLDYILGISIAAIFIGMILSRGKNSNKSNSGTIQTYGNTDRFAHMIAFSGPWFHHSTAAIDDFAFRNKAKEFEVAPPIFVTSLARGGTTTVLNALSEIEGLATHRYSDMPFISAPFLWNSIGSLSTRNVGSVERAHGDGLEIKLDSPEAFDEIFWKMFWPEKYESGKIDLWESTDIRADAQEFFRRHFKKICYLRRPLLATSGQNLPRYLSKNNANIARLQLLPEYFPGCNIVVPIRRPAAHASSLLRQHKNFLKLQKEDEFVRRYMRDIGHLEFGLLHQPIAFPELRLDGYNSDQPDYWLAYWIAAFREVLAQCDRCHIVAQDDLRGRPNEVLLALAERLGILPGDTNFRPFFHQKPDVGDSGGFNNKLLQEAEAVYDALAVYAVV